MAFEGRPVTLRQQRRLVDQRRAIRVDDDEVRKPAFANIATLIDTEQISRRVAGLFDNELVRDLPALRESNSRADWYRRSGAFCRHLSVMRSSSAGTS